MWVVKASGEFEKFDRKKIKRTCIRAGATRDLAEKIAKQVERKAYDGISSREILNLTLRLLKKQLPYVASKYDLKGAIFRIGPAGFPFEHLFAQILEEYGYKTKVHALVKGAAVTHEIDIVASKLFKSGKHAKHFMIECKYHNSSGIYTGIKESLYTYARFLDLKEGFKQGKCKNFSEAWLVSNTRFSREAIKYANYNGVKIVGWKYPSGKSLETLIEKKKLYPITVLRGLDRYTQMEMIDSGLILCKDLLEFDINKLNKMTGVTKKKLTILIEEARRILG